MNVLKPGFVTKNEQLKAQNRELTAQVNQLRQELGVVDFQIEFTEKGRELRELFPKYKKLKKDYKDVCHRYEKTKVKL